MNSRELYLINLLVQLLPLTLFWGLKRNLLRWTGASIGKNVRIVSTARFYASGHLKIGDDAWICHDVLIVGGTTDIIIGAKEDITPRVTFISGTYHQFTEVDKAAGDSFSIQIMIDDGVWIGASSTVLGRSVIGKYAIFATDSLIKEIVDSYSLYAGVSGRLIKKF